MFVNILSYYFRGIGEKHDFWGFYHSFTALYGRSYLER